MTLDNRASFQVKLESLLQSVRQNGGQHSLLFLDLDQFKVVNDTCGHLAGDEMLKHIGGVHKYSIPLANVDCTLD